MKTKNILITMLLAIATIFSPPLLAQSPNFMICDDMQGAAFGLCRGGVAVGCDVDGNSNPCEMIAEQYVKISGSLPPYTILHISPSSGLADSIFTITDPEGRIQQGDIVLFYEAGTPTPSGEFSYIQVTVVSISPDGTKLTGVVPLPNLLGPVAPNLIRVTDPNDIDFTSRFTDSADLTFIII